MIVMQCDVCRSMDNDLYGASCCDYCWREIFRIVNEYAKENWITPALKSHLENMKPVDLPLAKPVAREGKAIV